MLDAFLFWALVTGVGVAGLPLAAILFPRLGGVGLGFARPVALLAVAFPVWLLASLDAVPYRRTGVLVSLAVLAAVAAALRRRGLGRFPDRGARTVWLVGELLFTVCFFGWALLRSFAPDVWHTEKPMDMALVNTVNRADSFPPPDPWQSGTEVNYYYWGHYLVAFLVRAIGIDPAVGFNLAVALFFALAATAVFFVAAALYGAARRGADAPPRSPVAVGLTAAAFATLLGNLAGGVELLRAPAGIGTYDWWSPSRVIEGTANEFPFFSFLLADLHAHVMVTPFTLVAVAYAVQLALHGPPAAPLRRGGGELVLAGLVLGALYALNSFDYPTACVVGAGALLLWAIAAPGRWRATAGWGAAWLAVSLLLFLPFWLGFSPDTDGIGLVREHPPTSRFARDYLLIYGLPVWALIVLFAGRLPLRLRHLFWAGSLLLFVLVLLSPPRLAGQAVVLVAAAAAVFLTFASGRTSQPSRVLWLLTAAALGLVATGEVLYVRDVFDGTPSFRFNTVFKTGYQAWFLLAVAAAVTVYWSARWVRGRLRTAWLAGLAALVALSLAYPVAGTYSRSAAFGRSPTLDGMRWLEDAAPDDAAAIEWLRRSVRGSPTLLETVGRDFDPDGRARVSTFTGLPAVMGWAGHEVQWGHDPGTRLEDVRRIYGTADPGVARSLLERYGVDYVFVGLLERRDYPEAVLAKFEQLGRVAFRSGETVVYRVEGAAGVAPSPASR